MELQQVAGFGESQKENAPPRTLYDLVFSLWETKMSAYPMPYGSELERDARALAKEIVDLLWSRGFRPTRTILDHRVFD